MRTGDRVLHRPSGETWIVAVADEVRNEVIPCGWPCSFAKMTDCELKKPASDAESHKLLLELADMNSQNDPRRLWALRQLNVQKMPSHSEREDK